jgi:F420-0:gamma-glutamyl ligase-like protein
MERMNPSMDKDDSGTRPEDVTGEPAPALEQVVALAFAPLHKRAFGVAVGAATALLLAMATSVSIIVPSARRFPLELLGQYFTGYSVSWSGLVTGSAWAFFVGFVAGWFVAFARNLVLATVAFLITARAELESNRDFLDHI